VKGGGMADYRGYEMALDEMKDRLGVFRAENEQLRKALTAAWHALESYAHHNGSPELAVEIAAYCKATLDGAAA
jgi:type VI protein secretion system component VasF